MKGVNKTQDELASIAQQLEEEGEKKVTLAEMYDYISFANYFHKWKEKIQRGECPISPANIFMEWEKSEYRKECQSLINQTETD